MSKYTKCKFYKQGTWLLDTGIVINRNPQGNCSGKQHVSCRKVDCFLFSVFDIKTKAMHANNAIYSIWKTVNNSSYLDPAANTSQCQPTIQRT